MSLKEKRGFAYMFVLPWDLHHVGGVNQVVINLYRELKDNSFCPFILVNRWRSIRPREENVADGNVVYFRLRGPFDRQHFMKNLVGFILCLPYNLAHLAFLLKKYRVKVINPHFPDAYIVYFLILRKLGIFKCKILVSFHGADINFVLSTNGFERKLWEFMLERCDGIVTCSCALKRKVLSFRSKLFKSVHVIHNGIDIGRLENEIDRGFAMPREAGNRSILLSIGTFEHKKGQDVLLYAFKDVISEKPDAFLVLIGRSGPTSGFVKSIVRDNGLENHVLILEDLPHRNIANYLQQSTMFILPSRSESFGIVILEAGAFALPVIASDVDGIPEIITGNETGILVDAEDPRSLANAILFLLENPEECKRLGLNLNRRVKENFTWDQAYRKYAALALSG